MVYSESMDDACTVSHDTGATTTAPVPVGDDPLFAALAAHTPPWTRRAVVQAGALADHRWHNLRRGRVNWTHADLRALAPLLGETPAALAALLERSGRYVRPDAQRKSPRRSCPKPHMPRTRQRTHTHSHSPARPSGAAPKEAA